MTLLKYKLDTLEGKFDSIVEMLLFAASHWLKAYTPSILVMRMRWLFSEDRRPDKSIVAIPFTLIG
jgi:hypothetical protein